MVEREWSECMLFVAVCRLEFFSFPFGRFSFEIACGELAH